MLDNIRMAFVSLWANKMRALLTMLGIIIGIGSVIAIVTVGDSLSGSLTDSLQSFGINNITVSLQQKSESGSAGGAVRMFSMAQPSEEDLITDAMLEEYSAAYGENIYAISLESSLGAGTVGGGEDTAGGDSGKTYKVAMITDTSISDGGWGMSCYNAMVDAAEERGWETDYSDMIDQSAYYDNIVAYCDLGYDLIFAPGNQYTVAVLQAAEEYPDVAFALLNGGTGTPAEAVNSNVTSLLPDSQQVGWIAGALAGLMTETGTIAFIGGMELDTTQGKYAGYAEAAAYVGEQEGKTVTTLDIVYSNSFSASDKGIEFAKAMMDQGADVFFGDASSVDSGARQAIDEANAANGEITVYDIAQPSDLLGQNECIIGSQVTDNALLVSKCMEAVENGTFGGEVIYGTMQDGILSAGALSDLVPADKQEKYQTYIQQMIDGTFMQ